jgi:galactokinase
VAPGRVNLIGEHTDYNDGFVLPIAVDRETAVLASPRNDGRVLVYSKNLERRATIELDTIRFRPSEPWVNYISGVMLELQRAGHELRGAHLLVYGDVPLGGGLSSSGSLEVAIVSIFESLCGFTLPGPEAARLCRRVENGFLELQSGIMDQFTSRMAKRGCALFLDCRTHEFQHVPVPVARYKVLVCDTRVERKLTDSKYNERVSECKRGADELGKLLGRTIAALRDVTYEEFQSVEEKMSPVVRKRSRHIVSENDRVLKAVGSLKEGNLDQFGSLMNQSHESLRTDYEVSCPELDLLVELARSVKGTVGSRMTGAGFGGCTVSIVDERSVENVSEKVRQGYTEKTGIEPGIILCELADGAHDVSDSLS